jgi:G3E family GTPase
MINTNPLKPHVGQKKTKVYLLSGFLGAGKTTLLKRILSWEEDLESTVVIVNEFGDVGIDKLLLEGQGTGVVELTGGCICCALKTDLAIALQDIQSQYHPRRVYIEATGVADPGEIVEVMGQKKLKAQMALTRTIAVLEADLWQARQNFGSFFNSQLATADLILLNKADTIEPEEIPRIMDELVESFPHAAILPTVYCNIDRECIWTDPQSSQCENKGRNPLSASPADTRPASPSPLGIRTNRAHLHDHDAASIGFVAFSYQGSETLDEQCFQQFAEGLPLTLFRMKGLVRFPDRTVMVNYVGKKGEWEEREDGEETRLAFVGLRVNPEEILEGIRQCVGHA